MVSSHPVKRWLLEAVLLFMAFLFLMPVVLIFLTSFKPDTELLRFQGAFPEVWTLENYREIWGNSAEIPILRWLWNSFFISTCVTILVLTISSLCAFALCRLNLPGRKSVITMIVATMMVPGQILAWARAIAPSHPLTVGQWNDNEKLNAIIYSHSDIITFHDYGVASGLADHINTLKCHGRPLINTEWLNRGAGSVVESCLPVFRKENVGCMHWGLVNGKTQTHLGWGSRPGKPEPAAWQHDLYHGDHTPYDEKELALFRNILEESRASEAS